jgi:gas vesicle protein
MNNNIDVSTFLWAVGSLIAVILSLVGAIYALVWSSIKSLKEKNDEIFKQFSDLLIQFSDLRVEIRKELSTRGQDIYKKIDEERKEWASRHDSAMERVFERVDKTRERVEDLRETVSHIGSIYLTRREFENHSNKSEGG